MKKIITIGTVLAVLVLLSNIQTVWGAFSDTFISVQLAPSPSNGRCLTTNGTSNLWSTCSSGGGGGGSDVNWTFFNNSGVYVSTTTNQVLIGDSATTSLANLEVGFQTAAKGSLLTLGSTTLQHFTFKNATGTSATTTNWFSTTASSTNLFGQLINGFGLSTCTGTNALTWSGGSFSCTAQPQGTVTSVSGTSNRITSSGGATPAIDISGSYVGQSSITTLGTITTGVWTGTAIANANLANSTISGVALGGTLANLTATDSTLTFSGTYTGATARTIGLNLGNGNMWTALQQFGAGASSTQTSIYNRLYVGATATTTIDSTGNIVIPSSSNLTITGKSDGCATFSSGQLNSTGSSCGSGGGSGNNQWATSTSAFLSINPNGGNNVGVGIGTSTPAWALQIASSTRPQLALSDGSLTSDHWTMRNASGVFYLATSSPSTYAASAATALTIDGNRLFSINGNIAMTGGTTNGAGRNINFGTELGTPAIYYYDAGAGFRYGVGLNVDELQNFVAPDGGLGHFSWNGGGDMQPTGTNEYMRIDANGRLAVGTTTPTWTLTIASTSPVFELNDTNGATNQKHLITSFDSGIYRIATSSDTTLTSTSSPFVSIDTTQPTSFSFGSSTPTVTSLNSLTIGTNGTSGTTTVSMGKIQFDGSSNTGSRVCAYIVGTSWVISSGACTP